MTKLKLLSAALIATAMIATPAMARQSHVTSRHLVEDANATPLEDVGLKIPSARLLLWRGSSAGDAQQLGRESLYHLIVENRRPVCPACIPLRGEITQTS